MRLFTAVVPPPEVVDHLDAFLEHRRAAAAFRWTRPEHFHLTLAFMGDASEHRVEPYVERLATSLDGVHPPRLRLQGAVTFPDVTRARILAAGVDDPAALAALAVKARNAAVACGIEVDGQQFRAHLTVARTGGHPVEMTSWVRLLDDYRGPSWDVDRLDVVASHLGEGPRRTPRYETLAVVEL